MRSFESSKPVDGYPADAYDLILERGAQCVAVGRETRLDVGNCVREDGERCGMRKATSVGAEKLVDLIAFVSDRFRLGVDGIDDHNDFGGGLAARQRPGRM